MGTLAFMTIPSEVYLTGNIEQYQFVFMETGCRMGKESMLVLLFTICKVFWQLATPLMF